MSLIVHPLFAHTVHAVPEPRSFFDQAPDDVLHRIAAYLKEGASLARLRRVNKRCRGVVDRAEDVWRALCLSAFGASPDTTPPGTWAELYRFNMAIIYEVLLCQTADAVSGHMYNRAAGAAVRLPRGVGLALA